MIFLLVNKVNDKKNQKGSSGGKKGSDSSNEKESSNFRTSMFIMGFLVVPLVLVIIVATIVRVKNLKLRRLKLAANGGGTASGVDARWKKSSKQPMTKNGFTRLNQESDGDEAESLNKPHRSSSNHENSDYDTEEDNLPTLSKA